MNDDPRLERLFADGLHDLAPVRAPDRLRTQVKAATGETRPRARWLALIKEPPMRTNNRTTVGSPTARAAAVMLATLLATLLIVSAGVAGATLLAADDDPIVVDQAGGGDFTTIAEAVAAATDGDEIVVRPGRYLEAVVIDKDITLRGDGPVADIVMAAPEGGPTAPLWTGYSGHDPYALLVTAPAATISGLSFEGLGSEVFLVGGSQTLSDSVFTDVGWAFDGSNTSPHGSSVVVTDGGSPTVKGNQIRDGGPIAMFGGSSPTLEANVLTGGPHLYLADYGDALVISGNTIDGTHRWAIGAFDDAGHVTIEGNVITNPGDMGVTLDSGSGTVSQNDISGATVAGIEALMGEFDIVDNRLSHNRTAIMHMSEGVVAGNVVRDSGAGIVAGPRFAAGSGATEITGNDVEGSEARGIVITGGSPLVRDNRSCSNGENFVVVENATPDVDDSNEFCEEPPAE